MPVQRRDHDSAPLQVRHVALIGRISRLDQRALAELHGDLARILYCVANRLLKSHECAEEIVSDVMLHVWRNACTYDPARGTVIAWTSVAARSRAIDRIRHDRVSAAVNIRGCEDEATLEPEHDEMLPWSGTDQRQFQALLSALPPVRRQLLSLAYVNGCTHDEIARTLNLPIGTVKSHLRRTLSVLRTRLRKSVRLVNADSYALSGAVRAVVVGPRLQSCGY